MCFSIATFGSVWLTTEAHAEGRNALEAWAGKHPATGTEQAEAKVRAVREAMVQAGADLEARRRMEAHVAEATRALAELHLPEDVGSWFEGLAQHVTSRTH